ncbi:MAG: Gfo/Idh/MocA family oxidoreductase [Xanthomonadales bacterium]|nr:Gfo/Idh/MocA family oxidoreductase [Xanthomonadales bacterium]
MNKKIRLGILGTGNMARAFATGLSQAHNIELLAVASRTQESAARFSGEFGVPRQYADYLSLAADPDIELVYIATPHSCHMQNSLMCLDAGKSVLCEKPFAINASETELVLNKARQKNLFLMEAMWTRYLPSVIKLRELLADGVIGNVQMLLAGGAFMPPFDPDAYLFRPELGGGVLLDAGVYLISMASMVFGAPSKVCAVGSKGQTGVDEHDAFVLEHDNGAIASMFVSLRANSSPDLTLLGDRGKIYLHAPVFAPPRLTLSLKGLPEQVLDFPYEGNGYHFQAIEAADCILAGRTESSIMPLSETLAIMQTMDEIRQQLDLTYPMEK